MELAALSVYEKRRSWPVREITLSLKI